MSEYDLPFDKFLGKQLKLLGKLAIFSIIFLALLGLSSLFVEGALTDGLVNYWSFDTNTTGDVFTLSTSVDTTTNVIGKLGNARKFTSSSGQYIYWNNNAGLNTKTHTINFWFNLTTNTGNIPSFWKGTGTDSYYAWIQTVSAIDYTTIGTTPNQELSYFVPNTTTWYMATFIIDDVAKTKKIYINGVLKNTTTFTGSVAVTTNGLIFGKFSTNYLNGVIDELGFWNVSLSDSQILELYANGDGYNPLSPIPVYDYTPVFVSPTSANNSHINLDYTFINVTTDANATSCNLSFNNTIYTMANVSPTNFYYNVTSLAEGEYVYNVTCSDANTSVTSETRNIVLDFMNPIITWTNPNTDNTSMSIVKELDVNVTGTDMYLYGYRINVTDINNTQIFYNDSTSLTGTSYTIIQNVSLPYQGVYNVEVCFADSHTDSIFQDATNIVVDKNNKKLVFDFEKSSIDLELSNTSNKEVLKEIKTNKIMDRYNYVFDFTNIDKPTCKKGEECFELYTYNFRVYSNLELNIIENSEYAGHIVIGNPFMGESFWMDFNTDNKENKVTLGKKGKLNNKNYIDVEVVSSDNNLSFNSIGGLNIVCEDKLYSVFSEYLASCNETITLNTTGVPVLFNWTTDAYTGDVNIILEQDMLNYVVANTTGYTNLTSIYSGEYNVLFDQYFTISTDCTLDFCVNSWVTNTSTCIDGTQNVNYIDSNNCSEQYEKPSSFVQTCTVNASTFNVYFLIIILGLVLLIIGFIWKNNIFVMFGGLLLFLCGVMMLVEPINNLTDTMNLIVGVVLFGFGAWLWVTSTLSMIDGDSKDEEDW